MMVDHSNRTELNRRGTFRHSIRPITPLDVEFISITPPRSLHGRILDISLGGMAVLLTTQIQPSDREQWMANFTVPHGSSFTRIALRCHVVHCDSSENGIHFCCGIRFIDIERPYNDDYYRALWQFLLEEQRRCLKVAAST